MSSDEPPKGVILKIFGAVLIFVGLLNMMLLWRANLFMNPLFILFLVAGAGLYAIGMGRARYAANRSSE